MKKRYDGIEPVHSERHEHDARARPRLKDPAKAYSLQPPRPRDRRRLACVKIVLSETNLCARFEFPLRARAQRTSDIRHHGSFLSTVVARHPKLSFPRHSAPRTIMNDLTRFLQQNCVEISSEKGEMGFAITEFGAASSHSTATICCPVLQPSLSSNHSSYKKSNDPSGAAR